MIELLKKEIEQNKLSLLKQEMKEIGFKTDFDRVDFDNKEIQGFLKTSKLALKKMYEEKQNKLQSEINELKNNGEIQEVEISSSFSELILEHYPFLKKDTKISDLKLKKHPLSKKDIKSSNLALKHYSYFEKDVSSLKEDTTTPVKVFVEKKKNIVNIYLQYSNGNLTSLYFNSKHIQHSEMSTIYIEILLSYELFVSPYRYGYYYDILDKDYEDMTLIELLMILNSLH